MNAGGVERIARRRRRPDRNRPRRAMAEGRDARHVAGGWPANPADAARRIEQRQGDAQRQRPGRTAPRATPQEDAGAAAGPDEHRPGPPHGLWLAGARQFHDETPRGDDDQPPRGGFRRTQQPQHGAVETAGQGLGQVGRLAERRGCGLRNSIREQANAGAAADHRDQRHEHQLQTLPVFLDGPIPIHRHAFPPNRRGHCRLDREGVDKKADGEWGEGVSLGGGRDRCTDAGANAGGSRLFPARTN